MKLQGDAQLLTAESKPYNMNGNEGVSHKVRVLVDGDIFACKSSEAQVKAYKQYEGMKGQAELDLTSRKESLNITLENFSPD